MMKVGADGGDDVGDGVFFLVGKTVCYNANRRRMKRSIPNTAVTRLA